MRQKQRAIKHSFYSTRGKQQFSVVRRQLRWHVAPPRDQVVCSFIRNYLLGAISSPHSPHCSLGCKIKGLVYQSLNQPDGATKDKCNCTQCCFVNDQHTNSKVLSVLWKLASNVGQLCQELKLISLANLQPLFTSRQNKLLGSSSIFFFSLLPSSCVPFSFNKAKGERLKMAAPRPSYGVVWHPKPTSVVQPVNFLLLRSIRVHEIDRRSNYWRNGFFMNNLRELIVDFYLFAWGFKWKSCRFDFSLLPFLVSC